MHHFRKAIVAVAVTGLMAACFSGSSTQGSGTRKAPKRLGESSSTSESSTPKAAETPAAASDATATSASSGSGAGGEQTLRTLYVNVNSANVRSMPSKDATIVAKLKFLDPVGATGALDGEWVQVEVTMSDGAIGKAWIHSTLVSASREQAEAVKAAAGGK